MSESGHHNRMIKAPDTANSGAFVMPAPAVQAAQVGAHFRGVGEHPQLYGGRPLATGSPSLTAAQPVNFDPSAALRTAQHWAFHHANEAQDQFEQAEAIQGRAEETGIGGALADRAYARAERSRAMADTWATAARALAVAPGDQPSAYDLTVQVDANDAKDVARAVARRISDLRGTDGLSRG